MWTQGCKGSLRSRRAGGGHLEGPGAPNFCLVPSRFLGSAEKSSSPRPSQGLGRTPMWSSVGLGNSAQWGVGWKLSQSEDSQEGGPEPAPGVQQDCLA